MPASSRLNPLAPFLQNRSYGSIGLVYLIHSLPLGTWIVYIPYMKDKLVISEGQLGIALFSFAIGAVIMMPLSSKIIRYMGDGRATAFSTWLNCLIFSIPLFSTSLSMLCITLFLAGLSGGLMDISMNATASVLERKAQNYFMSGCHGFFSLGAAIAGGLGGWIASTGISPVYHMIIMNLFLCAFQFVILPYYMDVKDEPQSGSTRVKINQFPLIGIALIAMWLMMGEGAIHDWSTVYMKEVAMARTSQIGLGFAGYSFAMALGRFMGDWIQERLNTRFIITTGGLLASIGLLIVLSADVFWSIAGFTMVGFGLSGMVPVLFREASRIPDVTAAQGIATVAGVGYAGLLLGPVILGFIAEFSSLKFSFIFVIVLFVASIILSNKSIKK